MRLVTKHQIKFIKKMAPTTIKKYKLYTEIFKKFNKTEQINSYN